MLTAWLAILHGGAALLAVVHILLGKEDVRAAAGWIGFVVVAPVIGPALYAMIGINRVERRAERAEAARPSLEKAVHGLPASMVPSPVAALPAHSHLRQLDAVGERVGGQPLLAGNDVEPYSDGTGAYPPMLAAIDAATGSIALSSYIFRADRVGWRFVEALARARERGVDVRVMIDSIGSGFIRSPVASRLRRAGISVTLFSRDVRPWRPAILNLRNHKKILVVDGKIGFVGGLNFGVENEVGDDHTVRDTHFAVRGPVVRQILTSFASDLEFASGERLEGERWWPRIAHAGTVPARGVSSGPDGTIGSIAMLFAAAISEADSHVRIVTPYFLPDQAMSSLLRLAVLKGTRVDIVLPVASDQLLPHWAMQSQMRFLAGSGIQFHLGPPPFDHSKLMTVDGAWCAFGSPNWDPRSLRLNFEFLVECHDRDLTRTIDGLIDARIESATPIEQSGILTAPLGSKLRDAGARLFAPYL